MYETRKDKLAPLHVFYKRQLWHFMVAGMFLTVCLAIGTLGYHYLAAVVWIDAFHNACMILSGMGPVVTIENTAGKLFSSFYALFSGVAFITNIGVILAPAAHRLFHRFHVDDDK